MARIATNELTFQICDLWGAPVQGGTITDHIAGSAELERGLNDMRTAAVKIDIYDAAGSLVQSPNGALTRVVKAYYNPTKATHPIFTGVLLEPHWRGEEATCELNMVDAPFRLQRAYLETQYTTPGGGKDIGAVMVDIIGRAANRSSYPFGAPGLGINIGTIEATYNINRTWEAGENCWDILAELSQLAGAPDLDFAPLDRTDGVLWLFNAWAPMGDDHSTTAWFEYNTGLANCADMEYAPSGDPLLNYFTALGQVPDDSTFTAPKGRARHDASIAARGPYEGWDTNDAEDTAVEQAKANEMVSAYHYPPDFVTIIPLAEGPGYPAVGIPPRWDIDYTLADQVRAVGRKGTMAVDIAGRVMSDTLSEDDETGSVKISLEVAPNVDPTGVTVF